MTEEPGASASVSANAAIVFPGQSEMARRLRAYDWSATPLGATDNWPDGLKTAIQIMLTSPQPLWIGWGKELIYFYNDPCKSIMDGKHPSMLGQPVAMVWKEIWEVISPMLSAVMAGDEGTHVESQLLIMERNGYREETYYTPSYSPILNGDGSVGGIICTNTDDTRRVFGERQVGVLRALAEVTPASWSWQDACTRGMEVLEAAARDLPFALLYADEPDGGGFSLVGQAGVPPGHDIAPVRLDAGSKVWPRALSLDGQGFVVQDIGGLDGIDLPAGAWNEPPSRAAMIPIRSVGGGRNALLIAALNPFRKLDDQYRDFLRLVGSQIASSLASWQAYEAERRRAESLVELDRAKTSFFSNVGQEFRTPLTLMSAPGISSRHEGNGRTRVLWVEDNADMREYVSLLLGERFHVDSVTDGQAALNAARANPPDLVLSDIMMPRLDGLQLLKALRADEDLKTIPIILLSARTGEEARIEGVEGGADDYLVKPFSSRELLAKMDGQLKMARFRQQSSRELRERDDRFSRFMSNLPGLAWIKDAGGRYVYANPIAQHAFGSQSVSLCGKTDAELFPAATAARFSVPSLASATDGVQTTGTIMHPDGSIHYLLANQFPISGDSDGPLVGGIAIDITERKHAADLANDQRHILEMIARGQPTDLCLEELCIGLERADDGLRATVLLATEDGGGFDRIVAPSLPALGDALRRLEAGVEKKGVCSENASIHQPLSSSNIETDERWAPEFKAFCRDHDVRSFCSSPLVEAEGPPIGAIVLCFDRLKEPSQWNLRMTEVAQGLASVALHRERAESDLRQSEQCYRQVVHALPTALYTTDADGLITLYNDAAVELWGRDPPADARWTGAWRGYRPDGKLLGVEDCPMAMAVLQARDCKGSEVIIERPDGTRRDVLTYPEAITDASGALVGAVNMLFDITERKQAERRQSLLLDELNHRVGNMLAIIQSIASQTLRETPDPAAFKRDFAARISSLSRAHLLLTKAAWRGVLLADLISTALVPFTDNENAIGLEGPAIWIAPHAAITLALMLHELATNATKYGALADGHGRVDVAWSLMREREDSAALDMVWREHGGPQVPPPKTRGFGARLLETSTQNMGGNFTLDFRSEGLECRLHFPADATLVRPGDIPLASEPFASWN